ncbi:MAG: hypothetical protein ACE3L7_11065 [Candidatus Pristimantibacillus sp.]
MFLKVDDNVQETFVDISVFNDYWGHLIGDLSQNGRIINRINIDGVDYFENFEVLIASGFHNTAELQIFSSSELELLEETIAEIARYSGILKQNCSSLGPSFYGEPTEQEWHTFSQLLAGFTWVHDALFNSAELMIRTGVHPELAAYFKEIDGKLLVNLKDIEEAMEEKEYVAIADIIKYELFELFSALEDTLAK